MGHDLFIFGLLDLKNTDPAANMNCNNADKPISYLRIAKQPEKNNTIAWKIIKKNKVMINDRYGFSLPGLTELQILNDVYFFIRGCKEISNGLQ